MWIIPPPPLCLQQIKNPGFLSQNTTSLFTQISCMFRPLLATIISPISRI